MTTTRPELRYASVPRAELASVLLGERAIAMGVLQPGLLPRISNKEALVIWREGSRCPCIVGIADEDREELFNWTVTFHRGLSPLTSWCHVLSPKEIERLVSNGATEATLLGLEAAWAGAVIAEAMVLSRRGYESISLPTCLATDTFAVARSAALYGARLAFLDTIEKLDRVRDRLKKPPERWRPATGLVLSVLLRMLPNAPSPTSRVQAVLLEICRALQSSRENALQELVILAPKLAILDGIEKVPAEQRVRILREIPGWISLAKHDDERHVLQFAAGYIISSIGGAERDLRLAESFEADYPTVLTWTAVLGGLGSPIYWSDAFGGMGRLVARELSRSLSVFDLPIADIAADELLVIADRGSTPVKIRTALRQAATISLRPGVVVQLPTADDERPSRDEGSRPSDHRALSTQGTNDARQLQLMAEQLFPFLRQLFLRAGFEPGHRDRRPSRKGKSTPQLPLKE